METRIKTATNLFRGRIKSHWDLYRHGVTASLLDRFLICREQTKLIYVDGWSSIHEPLALAYGSCGHYVLETAYGNKYETFTDVLGHEPQDLDEEIDAIVDEYRAKWNEAHPGAMKPDLEQQELVYGMAKAQFPAYFDRWAGDFTGTDRYPQANEIVKPHKWVSLEEEFCIPFTAAVAAPNVSIPLRGKRDGLFKDKKGGLWVMDHKHRSIINDDDILDTLPVDLQQMYYLWCSWLQGHKPVGVLMNVVRRPLLRRGKDESLREFLERIRLDCANLKRYDFYFIRYPMRITRDEVLDFANMVLIPLIKDVRLWYEGKVPHYMNPSGLITKYGRAPLFNAVVRQEFEGCVKRPDHQPFPELGKIR